MKTCSRLWEIDALRERRLSDSDAASHERHRASCVECRARWTDDERLATLGRRLEPPPESPLATRRLRAEILRKAGAEPEGRRAYVAMAFAFATVAVVIAVLIGARRHAGAGSTAHPHPTFASTIETADGARWTRHREGSVETVTLDDGLLALEVKKQAPDERFFVELPDGRIEVRGTRFDVKVRSGATERIRVRQGLVAWTQRSGGEVLLHADESWEAPLAVTPDTLPVASVAQPVVIAPAPVAPVKARAASTSPATTAIADEYTAAMSAYRSHAYDDAARRFSTFAAAHPGAPEAEDAAFLEASALAHAGRSDAAAHVAEQFLDRHASSFHARDAAVLVARAARNRGDCARARGVLARWSDKPTPDVASALGSCKID